MIPQTWRRYTIPAAITVIQWITDFSQRIKQLQSVVQVTQQGGAKELKVCIEEIQRTIAFLGRDLTKYIVFR